MFRRCSDNDGRTGCTPSHTTSFGADQTGDCNEHRGYDSGHYAGCHAYRCGHSHNTAGKRGHVHHDASRHRDADGPGGHGGSCRRCCTSDVDDTAAHRRSDDEPDARQVGDG